MEDYLNIIKEDHEKKLKEAQKNIKDFIKAYDPIESIYYVSKKYYLSHYNHKDHLDLNYDNPIVNFLFNSYLNEKNKGKKSPIEKDIEFLIKNLSSYCTNFRNLISFSEDNEYVKASKSQYIINLINPEVYPTQEKTRFNHFFGNINQDFLYEFGFSPLSAFLFSKSIVEIYSTRFIKNRDDFLFNKTDIKKFFKPDEKEIENFEKELDSYLEKNSLDIEKEVRAYHSLLDEDISWKKPLIKTDKGFLGSSLKQVEYGVSLQLESLIKSKKETNKTLWKKYNNAKSKYAENLAYESFVKIFGDKVHKNLSYTYNGKEYETDILIEYDNKNYNS